MEAESVTESSSSALAVRPTTSVNIDECVNINDVYVKLNEDDEAQPTLNFNYAATTTTTATTTTLSLSTDRNNIEEIHKENNSHSSDDDDINNYNDDNVGTDNVIEAMNDAKNEVIASNGVVVSIIENQSNSNNRNNIGHNSNNRYNENDMNLNNKIIKKNLILLYNNSIDVQNSQCMPIDESGTLSPGDTSISPIVLTPYRGSCDSQTSNVVATQEEFDEISRLFETRSPLIEKWLREKASSDTLARIHSITESTRQSPRSPKRASVTSDLFQQWLQNSPIKVS